MKFADRIKNAFKAFSMNPSQMFFSLTGFGSSLRKKTAENDPAGNYAGFVYAAISKRAKRVGAITLKLYDLKRNGDLDEIDDDELLSLLYRANPSQSMYQFFYTIEMLLGIWGSCPIYKDRMGGTRIMYLWPLRPDLLKAITNESGKVVKYEYRVGGRVQMLDADDVISINEPSPLSVMTGFSPLLAAGQEINADLAAATWNYHLLENFAEPGGVLSTEQKLDDKEFERLQKVWAKRQGGPENAGRWALLEKGLKAEPIGRSPQEMDLNESRRFNRGAICAILGVPEPLLTSENSNLENVRGAIRVFAEDTIEPQMKLIVGSFNEFLVPEFGDNKWLDYESPVPEDTQQNINMAVAGEGRWLTVNEAREIFQLAPLEGGDAIFKPIGVMPQVGSGVDAAADPFKNAPKPALAYEKVVVDTTEPSRKHAQIIRAIKARTYLRRKMIEGITERVGQKLLSLSEKHQDAPVVMLKLKGARMVQSSDKKEHDRRIIEERKMFLKALPKTQRKYQRAFKSFFERQRSEVMQNLENEGLPKGRGGKVSTKANTGRWINKVLFDSKKADDTIVELSEEMYGDNIKQGSQAIASLLGVSASDVLATPFVVKFIEQRSFLMLKVNETTRETLKTTLREGVALGEDIGAIRERISAVYTEAGGFRAETIARTEVGASQNFGRNAEMLNQKVEKKVWVATFSNTRDAHAEADGQVVGANEAYSVGGESLDYPGDPSGSPENVINCQCSSSPTLG